MDTTPSAEEIARFCAVANCDVQRGQFMLEAANCNFDMALQMYMEQAGGESQARSRGWHGPASTPAIPSRPRAPVSAGIRGGNNPTTSGRLRRAGGALLRLPFGLARRGLGLAWSIAMLSLSASALLGDRLLPAFLMRALRITAAALVALPNEIDQSEQARRFLTSFERSYGDIHPAFVEAGIKAAIAEAKADFKFVLAYLHSGEHQDTGMFCSTVRGYMQCAPGASSAHARACGDSGRMMHSTLHACMHATGYATSTQVNQV